MVSLKQILKFHFEYIITKLFLDVLEIHGKIVTLYQVMNTVDLEYLIFYVYWFNLMVQSYIVSLD